jgi:hypothetical protein
MSALLTAISQNVHCVPSIVFKFLNILLVKGSLSIPDEFLLPLENKVIGPTLNGNVGRRFRHDYDSNWGSRQIRSRQVYLMIASFFFSKVLVGSLLEHRIASRA